MSEINFPGSAVDGSTFFHGDNVCVYHAVDNTWECRSVVSETPQPPLNNVYMTTSKVYTLGDKRVEWQSTLTNAGVTYTIPPVATQEEVNDAVIGILTYVSQNSGSAVTVTGASEAWVQANFAPLNHSHGAGGTVTDHPTRAEFDTLVAVVTGNFNTLLAAITS